MGHYRSNVRDLEFTVFELLDTERRLGTGDYADLDRATAHEILAEVDRLATGPLAEPFADADRHPPVFDPATGEVSLPESFNRAYTALVESGWRKFGLPEHLGGAPAPRTLVWAVAELLLGSNPAAFMYGSGATFGYNLDVLGTEDQRRTGRLMSERDWGSTMVLTEPDAGSDVGAGRATATEQPDGSWHLEGVKRFITSAEWDWPENIIHLVLARPVGAAPGTKGLSMFLVPKYFYDLQTGELGGRNGVYVTNVEHKMGLKASTTCELRFGERPGEPAVGWLLGGVHDGIAQMFHLIENARMMVGTKAIATLSSGYLTALEYARTRVQGADMTQLTDRTAPRVTITHHPDVRRMLMLQKSYAEGMRALVLYTASQQDAARDGDATAAAVNDLLLPIVKGFGSERSYELLSLSLQTLGGSGYLQDYPIEQYVRDAKIDTLYEGTTAIQGQDLFFRKIVRDRGAAVGTLLAAVRETVDGEDGNGRLKAERTLLGTALADVQGMLVAMTGQLTGAAEDPTSIYRVGQNTTRLLMSLGDLIVGWLLVRQAEVAVAALDAGPADPRDVPFYEGKVGAAHFFAQTVLPELTARRLVVETTDNALMDLPEAAF